MNKYWLFSFKRWGLVAIASLLSLSIISCDSNPLSQTEDNSSAKQESAEESRSVESPAEDSSDEDPPATTTNSSSIDLPAIFGTVKDGWLPKVLNPFDLKRGMSPEDVGKKIPGAEQISKFGFSEVPVKDVPGIDQYKFSFQEDKATGERGLYSVTLIFDPALKSEVPYDTVAEALVPKYGEIKPGSLEKKIVTWIGPKFASAQLTTGRGNFDGHEFKIVVPK